MKTLPAKCATRNLDGHAIIIEKGETGYYLTDGNLTDKAIANFNEYAGADEEAVEIMTCASMFGWDIPAVKNYEEKL